MSRESLPMPGPEFIETMNFDIAYGHLISNYPAIALMFEHYQFSIENQARSGDFYIPYGIVILLIDHKLSSQHNFNNTSFKNVVRNRVRPIRESMGIKLQDIDGYSGNKFLIRDDAVALIMGLQFCFQNTQYFINGDPERFRKLTNRSASVRQGSSLPPPSKPFNTK